MADFGRVTIVGAHASTSGCYVTSAGLDQGDGAVDQGAGRGVDTGGKR